jgi:hypothetical protein
MRVRMSGRQNMNERIQRKIPMIHGIPLSMLDICPNKTSTDNTNMAHATTELSHGHHPNRRPLAAMNERWMITHKQVNPQHASANRCRKALTNTFHLIPGFPSMAPPIFVANVREKNRNTRHLISFYIISKHLYLSMSIGVSRLCAHG